MKHALIISTMILAFAAQSAAAACTVEFKAKKEGARIHTRISVPVSDCSDPSVTAYLTGQGYTKIQVVNITPGG